MTPEPITDPDDRRVAAYHDLMAGDALRRRGLVACEGRLVVGVLLESALFEPESILLTPQALESMHTALEAHAPPCPVYTCERAILEQIVGFDMHRGCIALAREHRAIGLPQLLGALPDAHAPGARPGLIAALEDLANHDNTGTILRSLAAFGGTGLLTSPRCCDPLYRKSVRVSMGHALRLPIARSNDWPGDLDRLRAAGGTLMALHGGDNTHLASGQVACTPAELSDALRERGSAHVALLIGAEGPGLTDAALARADVVCTIPMEAGVDSLNAGVAASIVLQRVHEWSSGRSSGSGTPR